MSAGTATRPPYAQASPAEVRAALLAEDREAFDRQYQHALRVAADTLSLDELDAVLARWRRIAWAVTAQGADDYRAMLADAERRLATGERMPGAVSAEQMRIQLDRRLNQA